MQYALSAKARSRWFTAYKWGGLGVLFYAAIADNWQYGVLGLMGWVVGYVECELIKREQP